MFECGFDESFDYLFDIVVIDEVVVGFIVIVVGDFVGLCVGGFDLLY